MLVLHGLAFGELLSRDVQVDVVEINVHLWNGYVEQVVNELISFLHVLLVILVMALVNVTAAGGVATVYDGLKPAIKLLTLMDFIDPELNQVQIVQIED